MVKCGDQHFFEVIIMVSHSLMVICCYQIPFRQYLVIIFEDICGDQQHFEGYISVISHF